MRSLLGILLLASCGGEPPPAPGHGDALPAAAERQAPAPAVVGEVSVAAVAARLLAGEPDALDRQRAAQDPDATVAAMLAAAAKAEPAALGRAPAAIAALGDAALPGLVLGLRHDEPMQRRIAALTLLQIGADLHARGTAGAVVEALAAARSDADPAVRAAAEHAWRRAAGDTTAIDQSRAQHEAATARDR